MNTVVENNKDGPWYTQPEHIKDDQERRPDHSDYDPSTLFIPHDEHKALTSGMIRYW